jgi:hypothetical protein
MAGRPVAILWASNQSCIHKPTISNLPAERAVQFHNSDRPDKEDGAPFCSKRAIPIGSSNAQTQTEPGEKTIFLVFSQLPGEKTRSRIVICKKISIDLSISIGYLIFHD